ncbi:MAG: primosomal protein N' [Actinomycetota bacterium]|nr:primosomal protein N' [Actinomycetota bacterium]
MSAKPSIAKVILDLNTPGLRRTYDYLLPDAYEGRIEPGSTVIVPVRAGERLGYVIEISDGARSDGLKSISGVVDGTRLIGPKQIELSRWMADYYLANLNETLKLTLPPGARHRLRAVIERATGADTEDPALVWLEARGGSAPRAEMEKVFSRPTVTGLVKDGRLSQHFILQEPTVRPKVVDFVDLVRSAQTPGRLGPKQAEILADLQGLAPQTVKSLLGKHGGSRQTLSSLADKGLVTIFTRNDERRTNTDFINPVNRKLTLNQEQENALARIEAALKAGAGEVILLDGVTGSGKTEVYIRAAETCLKAGRAAIFLVPEIALLPQLVERLALRFDEQVAILHSGLKAGERFDAWQAVAAGRKKIIVGARSALFAPVEDLGLIVIDEEHETSYKQNSHPRYDARVVAAKLADIHGAAVALGSATPSLETQQLARGHGAHIKLNSRVAGFNLPRIGIVDMREEMRAGNYGLFSQTLIDGLRRTLDSGLKAILLINRRGFANFLLCRACGYVPTCDNCAISLTYHRVDNRLHCHHCDVSHKAPETCPNCQNIDWRYSGAGTQRVEDELNELFNEATVIRMDADTTARQDAHRQQLLRFYHAKGAILLGTQMIAKGLDFPEVALVGIVNADTALNLPDFRAAERTAQLLTQVSGRSGRGPVPGEVIIQTFNPENYAVQAAGRDYKEFCAAELEHRRELGYPPFSTMINIIVSSQQEKSAIAAAEDLAGHLEPLLKDIAFLLGPAPAPISKIKGYWRRHLIIMTQDPDGVKAILRSNSRLTNGGRGVKIIIDIDPMWLL